MADKSDMSTLKLLESGRRARALLDKLNEPHLTISEMLNLLCLTTSELSVLRLWSNSLMLISEKGARWFYQSQPSTAQQLGLTKETIALVDDEVDHDAWHIVPLRNRFCNEARFQFAQRMLGLDALSQVGAMAFDEGHDSERWPIIADRVWTGWATRGSNCLILGAIKRGKSNLGLWLAERFLETGNYEIVSNIVVESAPVGYTYTPKLSMMLKEICRIRTVGKEALILFDEANLFWQKIETVQPRNISLSKLILTLGKTHANLVFISHFSELVPTIVGRTACAVFEKLSIKECRVTITEGKWKLKARVLKDVPPTSWTYSPDQLAWFDLDLDLNDLFTYTASLPEGSEQWSAILNYVKAHAGESGVETLDPKQVALWLRQRGQSERQIAGLVGRSNSTVHEWVSTSAEK